MVGHGHAVYEAIFAIVSGQESAYEGQGSRDNAPGVREISRYANLYSQLYRRDAFFRTKTSESQVAVRKPVQPRAGGFAIALSAMGELFTSIVDVTLVYPEEATRFWDMCCGDHVRVIVDVRERELESWLVAGNYEGDREFRKELHTWLSEVWTEKDTVIARTRETHGR